jgi:hypothetical protein
LHVLVSDNSTRAEASAAIAACCRSLGDPRLVYVQPPEPLSMAAHWDWALHHATERFDADHFTFVSSRWIVRPGALHRVRALIARHPGNILTYDDDAVLDSPQHPIRVARKNLTGRLLEIDAAQLLYLCSRAIFPSCLARMLNCVLPRHVVAAVRARFGDLFCSVAPDHCLAYRCLALFDRHYHLDEAVLVQYGMHHSTGTGMMQSKANEACADFKATVGPRGLTWHAPIPELDVNINVVFHEYCLAREQVGERFPEVDYRRYLEALAWEIGLVEDPLRRQRLTASLRQHGWDGAIPVHQGPGHPASPVTVVPAWLRLGTLLGRRPPEDDSRLVFRNVDEAIWFASRFPKQHVPDADHLQFLRPGWRLSA